MKFSKLLIVGLALCALTLGSACSKVPAGNVGVKVYLLGGEKGVDTEELGVGRYWIGFNEELYLFPTFTQNYVWTKDKTEGSPNDESITFQTIEGLTVGADVGISYHINPKLVSVVFQKYRKGVDEITDIFLRNMVRDAFVEIASVKKVEAVYGAGKKDLITAVEDHVKKQTVPIGIEVERIYLIGSLRLPSSVITAIDQKIQATQKALQRRNEVEQTKAEADKVRAKAAGTADAILAVATAQAKANDLLTRSLSTRVLTFEAVKKWDGVMPKFMTGDNGAGIAPMVLLQGLDKTTTK
ncbi:hypothetical protein LCGC14_0763420 [marine sediment metagenome]|uniref:Band 7 domain-containing protein n=1 Tax=marine sediment metagenome TaxID=412755 RepID=A0A0F9Q4K0_9ZZZZ